MPLTLDHPHTDAVKIIAFLKEIFQKQKKSSAVIAISGGVDSALSLTLLSKALPVEQIFPVLLPYGDQSMDDAVGIIEFNEIPRENIFKINIESTVKHVLEKKRATELREKSGPDQGSASEKLSAGNIMARTRMIYVYDLAKTLDALVVGTENKSEKYLGYFTRFGDEASDIEPIQHLYKTQIRQLVQHLQMPKIFLEKSPSAGLWEGQTDEEEFGFSYEQADLVMEQFVDRLKSIDEIQVEGITKEIIEKVVLRIESQQFKQEVPYHL